MAREYMIIPTLAGTTLQVTEGSDTLEERHLRAATDEGQIREAEGFIKETYYPDDDSFSGLHWKPLSGGGFLSTDYDRR